MGALLRRKRLRSRTRHQNNASNPNSNPHLHPTPCSCRAVFLHVITYNQAAIRLYSRASFSCVARLPAFYFIHTGRQPDPDTCIYDAFLFVQHTAAEWGHSGWDVVALAVSPLRAAWGRLYGCMPQFVHRYGCVCVCVGGGGRGLV